MSRYGLARSTITLPSLLVLVARACVERRLFGDHNPCITVVFWLFASFAFAFGLLFAIGNETAVVAAGL